MREKKKKTEKNSMKIRYVSHEMSMYIIGQSASYTASRMAITTTSSRSILHYYCTIYSRCVVAKTVDAVPSLPAAHTTTNTRH